MTVDPTAATPTDATAGPSSIRAGKAWTAMAAFLGALGAGLTFAQVGNFGATLLLLDTYWLSADLTWPRLIPAIAVLAIVLTARLGGRWGWLIAAAGLAVHLSVVESDLTRSLNTTGYQVVLAVTVGAAVGGALAVFGGADRWSRMAIGVGLALGMFGGYLGLRASLSGLAAQSRIGLAIPLGLCVVAALAWLFRGAGARSEPDAESPSARRSWATPVTAVVVALGATVLYIALMALLNSLGRASASTRRQDMIELLYQVGLFGLVVIAGLALAIHAYRRGGSVLARWVLVGLATGTVHHFTATSGVAVTWLVGGPSGIWLTVAVALAGAVVGAGLSRFPAVPWDGLGLMVLAVAVVLRSPQGQIEFADQDTNLRLLVVFTLGFVLATALTALSTQTSLRGVGGPGEVAALVGLGFVASLLAATLIFPASLLVNQRGGLGLAPAIVVATTAVGVLALYGLGRLARSVRRAVEAEARRGAT